MEKTFPDEIRQFGQVIKKMREDTSMTQLELADLCNVDVRTIQRIERGDSGIGLYIVFALAVAFKVNPGKLFETISLIGQQSR